MTEQKVGKLILLIEELRHDLPMVEDRHDPQAVATQESADTVQVIQAIITADEEDRRADQGANFDANLPKKHIDR